MSSRNDRDGVVLCGEREQMGAGGGDEAAVSHHGVRADDHLVDAAHHGEHLGVPVPEECEQCGVRGAAEGDAAEERRGIPKALAAR